MVLRFAVLGNYGRQFNRFLFIFLNNIPTQRNTSKYTHLKAKNQFLAVFRKKKQNFDPLEAGKIPPRMANHFLRGPP